MKLNHYLSITVFFIILFLNPPSLMAQKAIDFDGSNDHLRAANENLIDLEPSNITVEAWIKPNGFNSIGVLQIRTLYGIPSWNVGK